MEALFSSCHRDPLEIAQSRFVVALYDHNSSDPTHLSFKEGTLIQVLESSNQRWLYSRIDGENGWVPSNFVSDVVTVNGSSSERQIILEIGDQSMQKATTLAVDLEKQQAVVNKCAKILNFGRKGDVGESI